MAGDYIFQSARMAALKLTNWRIRLEHVAVYTACFSPVSLTTRSAWRAGGFLAFVAISHFLTDSRRWRTSNPWPAMPILQDQSLHAVQLAVIGAIFL
jgi:hypothetical protein